MRVPVSEKYYDQKEIDAAIKALYVGRWTAGDECDTFKGKISSYTGAKHVTLVNSGSSANLIALDACRHAFGWKPGDEIITCALGFPTTLNPIIQLGLIPKFVDSKGLNIDPDKIEEAITEKTVGIMIAHTLGFPFDVKKIKAICDMHGLKLISDSCDAFGTELKDGTRTVMAGTEGVVGTVSFYPAHHINSIEGGAVYTNNTKVGFIANALTQWGRGSCYCKTAENNACGKRFKWKTKNMPWGHDHKYIFHYAGYNLKMSDIHAAIGNVQIDRVQWFKQKRRENYEYYSKHIKLKHEPLRKGVNPFGFVIYKKDALKAIEKLSKYDIDARLVFAGNLTRQPYLERYFYPSQFPEADRIMKECFWIGVQPGLTEEQREYVVDIINTKIAGKKLNQYV